MRHLFFIILAILSLLSCEPRLKPEKPDNLIAKDKMTDVLYDMFIVSSAKGVSRVKFEKEGLNPEQYILKKHNIDSLQFAQSNDYYAHDVESYKSMIETIKSRITAEKEKYTAIDKAEQEEKKRKKDSLVKLRQAEKTKQKLIDPPSRVKPID
ncbi:uncharacterized protein DUF4296 [Winogradskyella wandonensis]|uniref:Uncharacterized protein DUF4296 n=1 Tax=Winogradskyella wandonensis TaxID=1442586 RepID=A0A4R1KK41_9FLAO|nr:DUF4296 domain-containing protein [Winogradskyella wandonensis]TCK65135.1 uncharacterized protein DUF4296 [Winogradskyella wandonensis]